MNRNSAKQKLKDLRTKLSNLDIEIRSLISKAEMEPGLLDAVIEDIDGFTQEIVKIKNEISKIGQEEVSESISLSSLYNEVKDTKKSPEEVNNLALNIAKSLDIPDYVLSDEKLFTQFMQSLRNGIQPAKRMNEESTTGGEGYMTKYAFKKK